MFKYANNFPKWNEYTLAFKKKVIFLTDEMWRLQGELGNNCLWHNCNNKKKLPKGVHFHDKCRESKGRIEEGGLDCDERFKHHGARG